MIEAHETTNGTIIKIFSSDIFLDIKFHFAKNVDTSSSKFAIKWQKHVYTAN